MSDKKKACDFAIFGVLGDLSRRKLIPSLYQLEKADLLDDDTRIIGVARHELSHEDFVLKMRESLETFVKNELDTEITERLLARLHYVLINIDVPDDYKHLAELVDQEKRVLVNYFSVAPFLFDDICKGLAHAGIVTSETRVVLEKPIGNDLASSQEINDTVAKVFTEEQVYRIDHYL
ncbi:MAG: glucose-6-phosphate dehydrogenase, partial [Desulfocapsa sp.]|nr:glucose-6-phosphate dehydrogenase [Desulfocapsa sp.]